MNHYIPRHRLGGCNHNYRIRQKIRFVSITTDGKPIYRCLKCGEIFIPIVAGKPE